MRPDLASSIGSIAAKAGSIDRQATIMEVCGTHTVSIHRNGIESLLPENVKLISGPGCPVCVTGPGYIDRAMAIAEEHGVDIYTFGDLVRVPGSDRSLADARAAGAEVIVVSSPSDALRLAGRSGRPSMFLGVGFETTSPGIASTVRQAEAEGEDNFAVLAAMKLIPPAMRFIAESPRLGVDGFLCPGHVSVITGTTIYEPVAEAAGVPCVVAGFEPGEILRGIDKILGQISEGRSEVENAYPAVVTAEGNPRAMAVLESVFEPADAEWRGIGSLPASGLRFRDKLGGFDARNRWPAEIDTPRPDPACRCGEVLIGLIDPPDCGLFGTECTPRAPRGACMVSREGSCSAWFKYSRRGADR